MMKGLIGRCLNHKIALDCVRAKARSTEDELAELKTWKTGKEKKLSYSEQVRGKMEKQMEMLRQVLEDKEKEIGDAKDRLQQAKEDVILEYRDFNSFLAEFGGSFTDGFDDYLRQVKASFPNLDLLHVSINAKAQTTAQPTHSKSTDELFVDDALADDPRGDDETTPIESQIQSVEGGTHQLEDVQIMEEKDEETPPPHPTIVFSIYLAKI